MKIGEYLSVLHSSFSRNTVYMVGNTTTDHRTPASSVLSMRTRRESRQQQTKALPFCVPSSADIRTSIWDPSATVFGNPEKPNPLTILIPIPTQAGLRISDGHHHSESPMGRKYMYLQDKKGVEIHGGIIPA